MKKAATVVACAAAVVGAATPPSRHAAPNTVTGMENNNHETNNNMKHHFTRTLAIRGGTASAPEDADVEQKKEKKKKKRSHKKKSVSEDKDTNETRAEASSSDKKNRGKHHKDASKHHKQHKSHQDKVVKEILETDDYYAILGVTRSCTLAQIQKAYRRRCVLTHPDKVEGGDRKAFDKVAEAYDVLNDEEKRSIYSQYGKAGLNGGLGTSAGGPAAFSNDILRSFFGPNAFSQRQPQAPRNRTVRYQLEVNLEDLYKGSTRTVVVTQPGSAERKRVEVHVERGMVAGQSITLSGEMDSIQDATPADLVFLLTQRPHPFFTRKGHDLAVELTIGLQEALCGVTRHSFVHLDGRTVTISSARRHKSVNEEDEPIMIKDGDVDVLKGEGMPKRQGGGHGHHHHNDNTSEMLFGDLYVQYRVEMPCDDAVQRLSPQERQELGRLLAKMDGTSDSSSTTTSTTKDDDDANVHVLQKAKASDFGHASGPIKVEREDSHFHAEEEDEFARPRFPFGTRQFRYYSNTGGNPFTNNPFFGNNGGTPQDDFDDEDGNNVQCQQM